MIIAALLSCTGLQGSHPDEDKSTATKPTTPPAQFPLPPGIADVDWEQVFTDAANLMLTVNTQAPWAGHQASIDARQPGCPDFWTGQFTVAGVDEGSDNGVSWYDDCLTDGGLGYSGFVTWETDLIENGGDPNSNTGRTVVDSRTLTGNGIVTDLDGVKFEFNGTASDSLNQTDAAYGFQHVVYSSRLAATVTGRDAFTEDSLTPDGWRSDLILSITNGDVQQFTAQGDVYLFNPVLDEKFDSIEADMTLQGAAGARPGECLLEPAGWLGVRDPDANWYDVVFMPSSNQTITGTGYDAPQSECDGCGYLYVQGVAQDIQVCIDFSSFVFDNFKTPDHTDYILPFHSL